MIKDVKEQIEMRLAPPLKDSWDMHTAIEAARSIIRMEVLDETPRQDLRERQRKEVDLVFDRLNDLIMKFYYSLKDKKQTDK